MTKLLEQAIAAAENLSDEQQDLLATWLLAEIASEDAFDRAIDASADKLAAVAAKAIEENRARQTVELDPDQL
jgi:hypothetical protein